METDSVCCHRPRFQTSRLLYKEQKKCIYQCEACIAQNYCRYRTEKRQGAGLENFNSFMVLCEIVFSITPGIQDWSQVDLGILVSNLTTPTVSVPMLPTVVSRWYQHASHTIRESVAFLCVGVRRQKLVALSNY